MYRDVPGDSGHPDCRNLSARDPHSAGNFPRSDELDPDQLPHRRSDRYPHDGTADPRLVAPASIPSGALAFHPGVDRVRPVGDPGAAHHCKNYAGQVYAHVVNLSTKGHLRRANVDEIVLQDEFTGFLLASHVANPGIPQTFNELLDYNVRMNLQRFEIPDSKVGATFGELSEYFNESGNGILIGITSEREGVQISDILSADASSLDTFIARKFEESGIDIEKEKGHRVEINPPGTLMIEKNDVALLIGVKQD